MRRCREDEREHYFIIKIHTEDGLLRFNINPYSLPQLDPRIYLEFLKKQDITNYVLNLSRALERLFRDDNNGEISKSDFLRILFLVWAERLSNFIYWKCPIEENVRHQIERDSDHGFPHVRRLEKFLKKLYLNKLYPAVFHLPAVFLAIRMHDVMQLIIGKDNHNVWGALYAVGLLTDDVLDLKLTDLTEGVPFRVDFRNVLDSVDFPEDWEDLFRLSLALHIFFHNLTLDLQEAPEDLSEFKVFLKQKLKYFLSSIENNLDQLNSIDENIRIVLLRGKEKLQEILDEKFDRINDKFFSRLKDSLVLFILIDKFDGVFPGDLSLVRLLLTRPKVKKPFYTSDIGGSDISDIGGSDINALNKRVELAANKIHPDDFSRILYEIIRVPEEVERMLKDLQLKIPILPLLHSESLLKLKVMKDFLNLLRKILENSENSEQLIKQFFWGLVKSDFQYIFLQVVGKTIEESEEIEGNTLLVRKNSIEIRNMGDFLTNFPEFLAILGKMIPNFSGISELLSQLYERYLSDLEIFKEQVYEIIKEIDNNSIENMNNLLDQAKIYLEQKIDNINDTPAFTSFEQLYSYYPLHS